jgi:hypothetical protein
MSSKRITKAITVIALLGVAVVSTAGCGSAAAARDQVPLASQTTPVNESTRASVNCDTKRAADHATSQRSRHTISVIERRLAKDRRIIRHLRDGDNGDGGDDNGD